MKRWILHKLIGHIPYYVYDKPTNREPLKVYRCTLCSEELYLGAFNHLYALRSASRKDAE